VDTRSLNRKVLENLIKCGALDSLGAKRSQLLAVYGSALDIGQRYQKDHASGQIGLFENETFAEMNEIKLPQLEEMPRPLLLKYEKELVGFYVTGHPLDNYKKLLAKYTPLYTLTEENSSIRDGQFVKVAGIVSQCNIKITKKGDSMAVLTLEDFSSKISVIVFPKTYSECSRFLAQDMIIGVEGRYQVDEREQKVNAAVVMPLEEHAKVLGQHRRNGYGSGFSAKQSYDYGRDFSGGTAGRVEEGTAGYAAGPGQKVSDGYAGRPAGDEGGLNPEEGANGPEPNAASVIYLRIAPQLETSEVTQKLQEILRKYSGNNMVFLDLLGSRKRVRLDPRLYIDARRTEAQDELKKLLGAGAFVVRNV
jgi:DNA polymerase-3 subunit alpha